MFSQARLKVLKIVKMECRKRKTGNSFQYYTERAYHRIIELKYALQWKNIWVWFLSQLCIQFLVMSFSPHLISYLIRMS